MANKKSGTKKITVILSSEEHAALVKKASQERRSIASFIRWVALSVMMLGCSGGKFVAEDGQEGSGGTGAVTPGAIGAAEIRLSPPASSIPNIGTRTSCNAGTTGTYTFLLGAKSQGITAQERVELGAVANGMSTSCTMKSEGPSTRVTASIAGDDSNSRRVGAHLSFSGLLHNQITTGELTNGSFFSDDTGQLWAEPSIADCSLSSIVLNGYTLAADFSCPVLIGDDDVSGCQASGSVYLSGCSD